jgi:hypothetical protein
MSLSGIDRARPSLSSRIQFPYSQRDDFRTSPLGVELDPIATHRGIYAIGENVFAIVSEHLDARAVDEHMQLHARFILELSGVTS